MDATRRLIVVRHAKSDWSGELPDHERPLAPRGLEAAPRLGRWLTEQGYVPELVFCSTARRTRETWQHLAGELPAAPPVTYDEDLYGADVPELLSAASRAPADVTTIALVAHEPGVSDLTLHLAGRGEDTRAVQVKFPTGAAAVLTTSDPWDALATAKLVAFFRPRD
ncbi:histidine phosphatase family protein [Amycolatopsis sp. FBCC-B4732]|uniref:SixA phosphatase family protein n=1 Tax=Amycolatopsis sp. FBCC-B4732 TaxID=3079339 RepID=UPI001FF0E6EB|nr:histidine phosphatase family protein [Amycolatopsis sp. FBCC-B4732]UOX86886.1 histidine phosphatase family protein [Amycolatopsis sp. FBCC-B4732]